MGKTLGYGEITVANMTEPFTVMLTNEAQQFATDSNRKVTSAQSYYTDIIVIRGSQERTDYTIGNITSGSGITVSKTNERVTFSVSVGATIGADTGVIEIPITLDGQTVKKQFSWSCGKQGPQGVKGENGSKGKSVQNVIEYYLATSASSDVTSSTNGWSTDPTTQKLTAEKKYLWNCKQTVYDDGTKGSITSPVICGTYGDKGIDGKNATYITVSGTNFDTVAGISKMASYISINGTKYDFMPTRGHTLVIINPSNGAVENIKSYDTYTTTSLLDTPLSEVESDKIICLFTADASGLTQTSRNTLNECGSNLSDIWTQARKTHVFIGMKGLQKGQAYEIVASGSNATKTVTAYYTNSGIVTNGANGQDGISPKVSLSKTGDTTTISIVDATGTHTQTVKDGTNGTPGAAGKDGKTSYFHVKYSNDGGKTFTGNSGEDTGIYMGSYTDYTEADSTDVKKYTWVKVKGDIGQKGDNAKNLSITPSSQYFKSTDGGKTFAPNTITIRPTIQGEISFGKWQYSIDGGVSFADVVSGQKGLTISNNVLTVSKDSSLYSDAVTMVTFRAVASDSAFYDTCSIAKLYDVTELEIGGVNLFVKATVTKGYWLSNIGNQNADNIWGYSDYIDVSMMKNYIASGFTNLGIAPATCFYDSNKAFVSGVQSENQNSQNSKRRTLPIPSNAKYMRFSFALADIDTLKIEQGTKATAYSQSPQDVQTAILSTKSELSSVSSKVDQNAKAITNKVENTTYQNDLKLVKGDISKANDGLNKWRYEIYPKSLFTDKPEDQSKYDIGVFIRNKNLTPSQSVLLDDASLSTGMDYGDSHIAYGLTFIKMSAAKSITTTFYNDDGASFYVNGKLIISRASEYTNGQEITFTLVQGWNCLEVVLNEGDGSEGFRFSTTLSALSECQLMNCYYGTPVARQSHITNQLVENTTNINGISTKVSKVTSVIGDNGENFTSFKNDYSDFKQTMNGFKTTVGQTYVTKDDFNGLEIGGVNLFVKSTASRGWWISNTGVLNADGGWGYSDYIDVSGMKNYIASGFTNLGISPATCFYDSNKTFISGVASKNQNSQDSKRKTLPIPSNAKYMRFSFALADIDTLKIEQGTKATAYSPAPEDDEINGQNLVSNLPSNWEQGTFDGNRVDVGGVYNTGKVDNSTRIRVKELVPVSGTITISNAYSNQSKKPIQHVINAFDVNKKYLGSGYINTDWNDFPKIVDMKDAKYIAVIVKYKDNSAITPSDISQICLKIERGTSATPFTLAPEDVNGKIVNVETIANQTAKKFEWIVKGGDSSSNFTLTDRVADLVAERINFNGLVTFSGLSTDAKNEIGKVAQSKVDGLEVGGRNLVLDSINFRYNSNFAGNARFSSIIVEDSSALSGHHTEMTCTVSGTGGAYGYPLQNDTFDSIGKTITISFYWKCNTERKLSIGIENGGTFNETVSTDWKKITKTYVPYRNYYAMVWYARESQWNVGDVLYIRDLKIEFGNKATDWSPAPEDYLPQANLVSNWTTNTTWIDGGKIYTGSITADKIATDAIKSRNYISSGGTQGSFLNLSDGSFTSPNLSWDSNGNLIAKNANLSGQITATKGSIGGWSVDNYSIYTTYDADQNIFGSGISGTKGKYVLWAGETNNAIGANRSSDTPTDASLVIYNNGGLEVRKTMVGNDKKNHLYTTILQSGQINLKMDDNYIGTITATDTISSNSTVTMSHVSMAAKKGYGWSILHTDDSGNLISDIQRDPGDTKIKIRSPITVSSTDITKYNAIETTGDVVVNGKIHANYGPNRIQFNPDNNGSIELYGGMPFIDFHFACSNADYTSRIISQHDWDCLTFTGSILLGGDIYNSSNGHYTWDGKTDAYLGCGNYSGGNNIYYYANYHAFYVNNDLGSGMMYINTNGVTSRVGFTKTSDERIKKNFESFDDNIIDAYMNIEPVKYQLKQSSNDNYHFGFKAQHVDKVFSDYGDIYNESFDICTSRPIDPDKAKGLYGVDDMTEEYGLRYDELIAPTTYMVQHIYKELESTKGELAKVKQEKTDLETRLQAIEAKLGL